MPRATLSLRVHGVVHAARWYSLITPPSTFRRCTGASSGTTTARRDRVAAAGESSRPTRAEAASPIRGAFDDDLDTVAALDLLRNVESRQDVPAGAKFETSLFVDRALGLELPREIGR